MTGDPYWSNVVFLSGFEGGSIVDESPLAQTVTATGGAATSSAQAKFGSQSVLNSQTSKLTVPDNAAFPAGTDAWTIEGWFRWTGSIRNGETHLMGQWDFGTASAMTLFYRHDWFGTADGALTFYIDASGTGGGSGSDSRCEAPFTAVADTWYHIVGEFDGTNTYRIYVDGACLSADTTGGINYAASSQPFVVGNTDDTLDGFVGHIDEVRFTAGVARYNNSSGFTPLTTAFPRGAENPLDVELVEGLGLDGNVGDGGAIYTTTMTDGLALQMLQNIGRPASASDTLGVSPLCNVLYRQLVVASETLGLQPTLATVGGIIVTETLRLAHAVTPNQAVSDAITEALRLADQLLAGTPLTITEGLGLAEVMTAQQAISVIDGLDLGPILAGQGLFGKSVSEQLRFADSLANFFGGDVVEGLGLVSTLTTTAVLPGTISEGLGLNDIQQANLVLRVIAEDNLELDGASLINSIYRGTIIDTIQLTAAYISPSGGFTTWAMNTRTAAVTEYSNYDRFNSFARLGDKYIGAADDGLYELVGETDDGDDIIARLKSGFAQWGGARFTAIKGVYLGIRGEGDMVLRVITGDDKTYTYRVGTRNMRSTRVHTGKGIKARYIRFELESTGQDFDLESVEFIPLVADRRV